MITNKEKKKQKNSNKFLKKRSNAKQKKISHSFRFERI